MKKTITRYAGLVAAGLIAASCSSGGSHAQAVQSNYSAVATSTAVVKAKHDAQVQVVQPCQHNLPHIVAFYNCAVGKLGIGGKSDDAKAKRGALESCLFEAGNADHVLRPHNSAGRLAFEQTGAPDCVSQILLANAATGGTGASATASATPAGSGT